MNLSTERSQLASELRTQIFQWFAYICNNWVFHPTIYLCTCKRVDLFSRISFTKCAPCKTWKILTISPACDRRKTNPWRKRGDQGASQRGDLLGSSKQPRIARDLPIDLYGNFPHRRKPCPFSPFCFSLFTLPCSDAREHLRQINIHRTSLLACTTKRRCLSKLNKIFAKQAR